MSETSNVKIGTGTKTESSATPSSYTKPQSASSQQQESISDVLEERLIDAEYKIWKKNTPYLYDIVMTHSLEWPSLTCQWLPVVKQTRPASSSSSTPHSAQVEEHSLLLGTHTTGEQNYLMVASAILPKSEASTVVPSNVSSSETTHSTTTKKSTSATTASSEDSETSKAKDVDVDESNSTANTTVAATPIAHYDDERGEVGGFGFGFGGRQAGRIEVRMHVKHLGEVNRARYMPQNHFVVATRGPDPEVYVFDLSKHPSVPDPDSLPAPQAVLQGHTKEGYGMAWSVYDKGGLVTSSEDMTVCLWDVQASAFASSSSLSSSSDKTQTQTFSPHTIRPKTTFVGHTDVVEDVAWHGRDPNLIGSVGDDRRIMLWDVRNSSKEIHTVADAHEGDINSVAFNPVNEFLFATGSADHTVALWDMRNLKQKMQSLVGHNDQVLQVAWAPFNEAILGSCSADRRVIVWDLSRIGDEQTPEDAEDGPPELLFVHGGHTSKVSDFSWNANDPWTIASVSEDNVLQVWHMAEEIYAGDDDDDDDEEEDEEEEEEGNEPKKLKPTLLEEDDIE